MAQGRRRQRSSGAASLRLPAEALHWSIGRRSSAEAQEISWLLPLLLLSEACEYFPF